MVEVSPSVDEEIEEVQLQDDDIGVDRQEEKDTSSKEKLHLWEVVRNAEVRGRIDDLKKKGQPRQNSSRSVTFNWIFTTSKDSVATRSPWIDWLDMKWSVRFQLSPFDPGILHAAAWSIFVDLKPPYERTYRITGTIRLQDGSTSHDFGSLIAILNLQARIKRFARGVNVVSI